MVAIRLEAAYRAWFTQVAPEVRQPEVLLQTVVRRYYSSGFIITQEMVADAVQETALAIWQEQQETGQLSFLAVAKIFNRCLQRECWQARREVPFSSLWPSEEEELAGQTDVPINRACYQPEVDEEPLEEQEERVVKEVMTVLRQPHYRWALGANRQHHEHMPQVLARFERLVTLLVENGRTSAQIAELLFPDRRREVRRESAILSKREVDKQKILKKMLHNLRSFLGNDAEFQKRYAWWFSRPDIPSKPRPQLVEAAELDRLRRNPDEALEEESIICLECGLRVQQLNGAHLQKVHCTHAEYRQKWGYEPDTPLCSEKMRRVRHWQRYGDYGWMVN